MEFVSEVLMLLLDAGLDASWCWTWCWTWCRTWCRTWCWTWCRCHCLSATGPIVTVRSVDAAGVWWELRSPQFSCAAAATVLLLALSDGSTVVLPTALLQAIVTLLPTVMLHTTAMTAHCIVTSCSPPIRVKLSCAATMVLRLFHPLSSRGCTVVSTKREIWWIIVDWTFFPAPQHHRIDALKNIAFELTQITILATTTYVYYYYYYYYYYFSNLV